MRFTEEHEQFRKSVRAVIESEINPYVDEWEAAGIFPAHELFPKLAKVGMFGLEYDPEFGGQGADHTFTVVLGEELGATAHCAGVPMAIAVQASMSTPALAKFGSDELKRTYLAPAMSGEMVTSVAVSEPDAGSDVAGIKTRAVRDGDDWVINGTKMWITSGTQADWICLLARTSDEGVTRELVFEDVRVPVSNTVGEIGRGFQQQMSQFQDERLIAAYMVCGSMRKAIDRTIEYLRQRDAFGKPLLANQYIQYKLAELIAEIDIVTEYAYTAGERYAAGEDVSRMATIAKLKTGRLQREVADTCVQFHGGMGYAEEMWPARYYRDGRLTSIGGGADEVMLRVIAMMEGMGKK